MFCGVDGAGKSTIVSELSSRLQDLNVRTTRKESKNIQNLVTKYWNGRQLWHEGPFSNCVALASCFDFLDYYDTKLKPLILGSSDSILLSDRYDICYHAFIHSTNCDIDISPLFEHVIPPDLLFYIHVDQKNLSERYFSRDKMGPDETPEVMAGFRKSYEHLLQKYKCSNVYKIDNNNSLGQSLDKIEKIIRKDISG